MVIQSFMSVQLKAMRDMVSSPPVPVQVIEGTGFVVEHDADHFLITNGHIVTGRHRLTDDPLGNVKVLPRYLDAALPIEGTGLGLGDSALIGTSLRQFDLYDGDDKPKWLVHPTLGRRADVVAIPIIVQPAQQGDSTFWTTLLPYSLGSTDPAPTLDPAVDLSVVGFPFGLTGGANSAVWVRGTVASEPELNFSGEPCFLIDARTRTGQSGSPVIRAVRAAEESTSTQAHWELVGVYAGRTDPNSDLGRVWRWSVLKTILEERVTDTLVFL